MIGIVQGRAQTANGAWYTTIDGTNYYTNKCETDPRPLKPGDKIDFEYNEFGDPGRDGKRPRGLVRFKPVLNGAGVQETGSTVAEVDVLRSVSNVVGSACAAGTIKAPGELLAWFQAAYAGFTFMGAKDPIREPGSDDDKMPESFYNGLPPRKAPNGTPW